MYDLGEHSLGDPIVEDCDCRRCAVATRNRYTKDAERWIALVGTHGPGYKRPIVSLQIGRPGESGGFACYSAAMIEKEVDAAIAARNDA